MLMPRKKTPDLTVPLVTGETFKLSEEANERGTVICFYRGLHCPICANYLKELERLTPEFAERGIGTVAVSTDVEERAKAMAEKVGMSNLRLGYGLSIEDARSWGLYISTSRGKSSLGIVEPDLFSEPGVFLVQPDRALYYMSVQTMPFVRPHFNELLAAVDGAMAANYPARGEVQAD
ncbi:peroxiredoxin-like family protein [Marinovum sp. 2_MG-2023]|uniref:peroxiredoxin-like family protein n=1 Tax=Roseobacteraceae TaxID=2854170 RepID=UPI001FD46BF5|nr:MULTISPECIES: peroxiredoxin-like family protein [Roseobacteraceae]MCJ7873103.1 AhpC/TSA family protein [Phaeobacter sp. J2-8]MDO6730782.1 peroxiredoxin-like family protein [Marinovum sp. 2_MG-2023]MDO6780013.1 peroxiredoxin-like family protein [Marinovum sp. 1_MG-2023]